MKLIEDWDEVLKKAWSIRLILLAGLLSGIEVVLPYFSDAIPRGWFAVATIIVSMLAIYARVTAQKNLGDASTEP